MSDPKDTKITRVDKRGEWYTIEGHTSDGKKGSVEVHAATLERMDKSQREAFMRRSVYGDAHTSQKGDST